jgi:hypothetical protein
MDLCGVVAFSFVIERSAPLIGSVNDDRPLTAAQAATLKRPLAAFSTAVSE